MSGTFFNKTLHCGVINCKAKSLAWYKEAVSRVSEGQFRGWTKDELVTTCVKIFVPSGFEHFTSEEYIDASRLMFETEETLGFPWIIIRDYIHHARHNKMIIAQIPEASFNYIKSQGKETSPGSGVWKADGFMAPLKLTIASSSDVHNIRTPNTENNTNNNNTKDDNDTSNEKPPTPIPSTSPTSSPLPSPKPTHDLSVESPTGLLFEDKSPSLGLRDVTTENSHGEHPRV
jgi:hypothetical protein